LKELEGEAGEGAEPGGSQREEAKEVKPGGEEEQKSRESVEELRKSLEEALKKST